MRAVLHPDIRLQGKEVVDAYLKLRYALTPDALWLINQLAQEERLDRLVPVIARLKHVTEAEARHAVYALLGQLGMFGAVRIVWGRSISLALRLKTQWVWCCRQPASVAGFVRALWRAYGWIFGLLQIGFIVVRLYLGANILPGFVVLPTLLAVTLGLHELGHVLAARLCQVPAVLLARPGYFAVMHRRSRVKMRAARTIAAAGPLVAIACCLLVLWVYDPPTVVRLFLSFAIVVHTVSLLPVCADGKTLWRRS